MRAGYRRQLHSLTQRDDPAVASHRPHAARHLRELLRVGVFARSFSHRSGDVSSAPWEIAGTFPSALPLFARMCIMGGTILIARSAVIAFSTSSLAPTFTS